MIFEGMLLLKRLDVVKYLEKLKIQEGFSCLVITNGPI